MEIRNTKAVIFARYLWLYNEIFSKGPVTFEEISEDWKTSDLNENKEPLPHKTFENHRKAIEDLFKISIECNRANNTYYIEQDSKPDFAKATFDMLNSSMLFYRIQTNPQLKDFIRPEYSGNESAFLFTIVDTLAESKSLKLHYRHDYNLKREASYEIKPIAIKQFRHRWYLIAELKDGKTYSFPLDRILSLKKGERVEPSTIDVDRLFADAYGIIREEHVPPERILLKVVREQANYFHSRPLHHSQALVKQTEDFDIFSLYLCPTYDFIMEILSHGSKVEVLEPQSLRTSIANEINKMSNLYSNK